MIYYKPHHQLIRVCFFSSLFTPTSDVSILKKVELMESKTKILDDIVSDSDESYNVLRFKDSGNFRTIASEGEDDDNSVLEVDGDDFRLDTVENTQQPQEGKKKRNSPKLFVEESSHIYETPIKATRAEKSFGNKDDENDESEYDEIGEIRTPPRKRVRFESEEQQQEEDFTNAHPWDFKKVVRSEFHDKLPKNYAIKTWKRPSKLMVQSINDILENNIDSTISEVFGKYGNECARAIGGKSIKRIIKGKENLLHEIVNKIKRKLKKSKFPARISDRELDIEYIFAKRKFIQERYSQELRNAETIEHQLIREQQKLSEAKLVTGKLTGKDKKEIAHLTQQLTQTLNPVLNRAMVNSYGLLADVKNNKHTFQHDSDELSLVLENDKERNELSSETIKQYLPSLKDFETVDVTLNTTLERFNNTNKDIQSIGESL